MRKFLKQAGGDGTLWPFDEVLAKRGDMHVVFSADPTDPSATINDDGAVGFVGIAAQLPGAGCSNPGPVELPNADGNVDLEKLNKAAAKTAAADAEAARKNAIDAAAGNSSKGADTGTDTGKVERPDPATFTDKAKLIKELKKFKVTPAANASLKKMQQLLADAYAAADAGEE